MTTNAPRPVAIVGIAAIMPQARSATAFWDNIKSGRYCITDVPPERWDPALYYDPDHSARDKTYSKIGGWVREFDWDPIKWRLPVPPTVAAQMDEGQRWAVSAARAALMDAGWPNWNVDSDNVAVILGNALGGEKHYSSSMRIRIPEVIKRLEASPTLLGLPADVQRAIVEETRSAYLDNTFEITEDTMPGELANVIAGRVCNLLNLRGPNFTTDAACASGLAALNAAIDGLVDHQYDAVVTGGVDRNMGIDAFVKFCKIGALSATGTRPFDAGADGFVMGEGAALFVLKRLEDAERDGDRIYSVILGVGGSSDGKGKGITAPNPVGQQLAVRRAWTRAGLEPGTATSVEAHGTSTRVGDAAELTSLTTVFGESTTAVGSIALGSVKSNIGHLKAAAGTAGLFKMAMSLHEKVLAPSLNFVNPNENVDWGSVPFAVNTSLRAWPESSHGARRGAVSAFGFGGTNFHVVLEEHVPGLHKAPARVFASAEVPQAGVSAPAAPAAAAAAAPAAPVATAPRKAPLRGALVLGGRDDADVAAQVRAALAAAKAGNAPAPAAPDPAIGRAAVRVAVDYADAAELAGKLEKLVKAFDSANPAAFRMLRQQGVFVGRGPAPKVAFLYTGQGSQYVNMLKGLAAHEPIVKATFDEADRVMTPLLGRPLTSYIFIDGDDKAAVDQLNKQLMQTEITQPAVLATDLSLTRLFAAYGVRPDMVMGHSLGEYGALVASGALTLESALEAVSARGNEMKKVSMADNGAMAAVFGPLDQIENLVKQADGYAVIANINSYSQAVVGGATTAVEGLVAKAQQAGLSATRIPVSHAFHTAIVAPASEPLKTALRRLNVVGPQIPTVANVTGEFYPVGASTDVMLDYLGQQVASPVQFVKGLETLYAAGARVFVEVGPKKALHGFVEDVLGTKHDDVVALYSNHPKVADDVAINQALCGLYAAGLGFDAPVAPDPAASVATTAAAPAVTTSPIALATTSAPAALPAPGSRAAYVTSEGTTVSESTLAELGRLFAQVLDQGLKLYAEDLGYSAGAAAVVGLPAPGVAAQPARTLEPVVVTGAALGLPGKQKMFDDANVARILAGENFISSVPAEVRQLMVDHRITRIVKDASGGGSFQTIDDLADVIKLAGTHAPLDVVAEFGVDKARDEALDMTTRMAISAGLDALRDAGIPLVMRYKTTTLGTQLPDRWALPESLRDDTGIIFAAAFPGYARFVEELEAYMVDRGRREALLGLEGVRALMSGDDPARAEVERQIGALRESIDHANYSFDRRFLFRVLAMGHSQFAELIGARGPNTHVNAACASTTQAVSLAEDWIRAGRCRRVIVVGADDTAGDALLPWVLSGFLATGAAATDERVEDAATPFDRRRHGMIVGGGAAAVIVESADSARERGITPIAEVLATITANSAFHGTRLDVEHIGGVMESLVREAEQRGIDRHAIASQTMFVSHETYTPARGGSAAAEINALRRVFGADADKIVITNTKGFTGHAMGAGIEDVVAVKGLETGIVPPVPNYKEPDPDLGALNLSRGGSYPVEFALRLAAGFGSQIAMSLMRRVPAPDGLRRGPQELGYAYRVADAGAWQRWLDSLSGHPDSRLEVDHRRLRLVDVGAPKTPVAPETHVPVPYAGQLAPSATPAPAVVASAPVASPSVVAPAAPAPVAAAPVAPVAAAPAAPVATPVPAPAPEPAAPAHDEILDRVTGIVSEMTGYPADLLDPDLDLEADLGVDTVKQAEVFAAVRTSWDLERDENLKLRDFPTLRHVAGWVRGKLGLPEPGTASSPSALSTGGAVAAAGAAPAVSTGGVVGTPAAGQDEILAKVTEIVADMTGYPADLLDPDLDLEADLGVDTVKQAEVFAAVRGAWDLERDENLKLRDFPTMNHVAGWVRGKLGLAAPSAAEPPAAPAEAPAAEAPADAAGDPVLAKVTQIVADMTGYPADLLDPDLDLEADLGVDTVKQAEVFAAVRSAWSLERDENLKLRDFPTLRHVAGWVHGRLGDAAPAAGSDAAPAAAQAAGSAHPHGVTIVGDLRAIDALPRRIPVPSLRPAIDRCVETGVVLDGARIVVRGDGGGVADALVKRLEKAGATVLFGPAETSDDDFAARLAEWQQEGPIAGVYWLPALDDEGDVTAYELHEWQGALQRRVKGLYATMRALWDGSPFLVSATRLGGYHGYDAAGAASVLGGSVTGFTKSYKKERPDALVKAVDMPPSRKTAAIADLLIEETLRDPGCVEIGRVGGQRYGVAFVEVPFAPLGDDGSPWHEGGMPLTSDSVFLVTGAAGSIVSAITADLAKASGGTFHLLDLTPTPDPDDADLATFRADKNALKATIATRLKESGQKATPVAIDREIARLERLEAALTAIEAVTDAGGTAYYYSVDLTDPAAVAAVLDQVRERSGRIDVLLHAAGLEISRNLPEKEPREYNLVFDVKTSGWFNVWHNAKDLEVGAVVVFSSVAGRFGNQGQTDYSAANDLLCKVVSNLRRTRPQTRGIATDWTAWGGIGMATRGSIPKIMEMAGVQMLPPDAGVAWVRRELESSAYSGEVIVAGVLGAMAAEYHETGGLAADPLGAHGPMIGDVNASVHTGITSTTTLDPAQQAFLHDHRIDGTPVLPGVMGMESFAEVASLIAPPGYRVAAVEDVAFAAPVKFFRDEPRTLTISAVVSPAPEGADLLARCTLTASRQLPGQATPTTTTHFTGTVRLTDAEPEAAQADVTADAPEGAVDQGLVYTFYFHGPAYQVVEQAWRDGDGATARMSSDLPDNHVPADAPLLTAPRLVELSFQTAGLWEAGTAGRLALPMRVGRTSVLRDPASVEGPLFAKATPRDGGFDVVVTDGSGSVIVVLDGYQTVQLPGDLSDDVAAALGRTFG
ncbi:MAG: SDR family NAD(P)-dependent oxidoreductase [Dermatophilaceae bacterium]